MFFQAEDGIRDYKVTGVQTCALPIFTSCGKTPISRALYQGTTEVVPNKSNQMSRALAPAETSLCFTPKLIPSPATSETQSPTPDAPAPQGTPIVTMFPHPE